MQAKPKKRSRFAASKPKATVDDEQASIPMDDYMSGAFLPEPVVDQQQKVKTSSESSDLPLARSSSKKAKILVQEEKLQEGLKTPLTQNNVGLKLLKMMGYKEGQGLGKTKGGIVEPINITKMSGREGIGVAEQRREKQAQFHELVKIRHENLEQRRQDYKAAMSDRFTERIMYGQLSKAMKATETLDLRAGRPKSSLWWSGNTEAGGEGGDGAEGEGEVEGDREEQEQEQERGVQAHQEKEKEGEAAKGEDGVEDDVWEAMTTAEKLSVVLTYLREAYHYCLHCGHQYSSAEELASECPGLSEDGH